MAYDGIYPYIRTRLQDSVQGVENSEFDTEIDSVLRRLLTPYSVAYDDVEAADLPWVDEAAGLTTAARLITPYSTGGANSDLVAEATETMKRSFATNASEKDRWLQEAKEAMAQVSFVKAVSGSNNARFARDGYRRRIEAERPCDDSCCT